MKESDFFKQLNRELQSAAPSMSERLKNEPIQAVSPEKRGEVCSSRDKRNSRISRGRITAILASAAAFVLVCVIGLSSLFSGGAPTELYACMYIDINPSLALTLDENYKVRRVVSLNADADTLTSDEEFVASLVGLSAQTAAVKVAERAANSGYFSLGDGDGDDYNELDVTIRSNAAVEEKTLDSVKESLIGFFCEKGVYVYVNARSETDAETETRNRELESRPASYFQWTADTQSISELERLVENSIYGYAEELLRDALYKYDLFAETERLNQLIQADEDNVYGLSYWSVNEELNDSVRELSKEMSRKLEELYLLYGTDYRERDLNSFIRYSAAYKAQQAIGAAADVDSLRTLLNEGVSGDTFGGTENLSVRLNYYCFVSNDILDKITTELWNGVAVTTEKLLSATGELIEDRAASLTERYSALFSLEREPIGEEAYAEFLKRIGK